MNFDNNFGGWFDNQGIIINNKFVNSKEIPNKPNILFKCTQDFDHDVVMLCSILIGIKKLGYGSVRSYPLFVNDYKIITSNNIDCELEISLIGLKSTVEVLLSTLTKHLITILAAGLLNLNLELK